ncbi:hypothetical protein ACET3Z_028064 [Daucus carota]
MVLLQHYNTAGKGSVLRFDLIKCCCFSYRGELVGRNIDLIQSGTNLEDLCNCSLQPADYKLLQRRTSSLIAARPVQLRKLIRAWLCMWIMTLRLQDQISSNLVKNGPLAEDSSSEVLLTFRPLDVGNDKRQSEKW